MSALCVLVPLYEGSLRVGSGPAAYDRGSLLGSSAYGFVVKYSPDQDNELRGRVIPPGNADRINTTVTLDGIAINVSLVQLGKASPLAASVDESHAPEMVETIWPKPLSDKVDPPPSQGIQP